MMMVDYKKYPYGKDQHTEPGIELGGEYYEVLDIVIALTKALIKRGVLTKSDVAGELNG